MQYLLDWMERRTREKERKRKSSFFQKEKEKYYSTLYEWLDQNDIFTSKHVRVPSRGMNPCFCLSPSSGWTTSTDNNHGCACRWTRVHHHLLRAHLDRRHLGWPKAEVDGKVAWHRRDHARRKEHWFARGNIYHDCNVGRRRLHQWNSWTSFLIGSPFLSSTIGIRHKLGRRRLTVRTTDACRWLCHHARSVPTQVWSTHGWSPLHPGTLGRSILVGSDSIGVGCNHQRDFHGRVNEHLDHHFG